MHKTIAHGCSFTRYGWPCWPKFVEWFTDKKMLNRGQSGSGNETISRAAIDSAMEFKSGVSHMYIMWSGVDRYEVITEDKIPGNKTYYTHNERNRWWTWYGGHPEKDKHDYYRRHFWNENAQQYRTLEHILRTQQFLTNYTIPYTMMIYKKDVLRTNFYSDSERDLYNEIDWTKFLFYKDRQGLWEFAEDHYKEYYIPGESHPPPIAHYHWVKDMMFKSDILCPKDEYYKLKNYFIGKDGRKD